MKYMIVNFGQSRSMGDEDAVVNIGETAMMVAIENLYEEMEIPKEQIIRVSAKDFFEYRGEYAICPINTCSDAFRDRRLHQISPKIIPVFIGLSINKTFVEEEDIPYLKRFEPIGCRDEDTLRMLRKAGIDSYLNGCLALTLLEKRVIMPTQNKVFFVDVPKIVKKYIPEEMKKDIVFIKQEIDEKELPLGMTPRSFAEYMINKYRAEARLVVTSRFHGAVIALALGIPVIVTNESYTYRFSWIKKMLPFYIKDNFNKIDWNPEVVDVETMKVRMKVIAKKRILEAYDKWNEIYEQSDFLEMNEYEEAGLIDYYDGAIAYIEQNWSYDQKINYAFWGVNNNAEYIYNYINDHYRNAKLVKVYDTFKKLDFKGVCSETPENIDIDEKIFIFVTTFIAGCAARRIFEEKGIPSGNYFVCEREYVTEKDL